MDEEPIDRGIGGEEEVPDERRYARQARRQRREKEKGGESGVAGKAGNVARIASAAATGDLGSMALAARNLALEKLFERITLYCYSSLILIPVGLLVNFIQFILSGVKSIGWDGIGGSFGFKKGIPPPLSMSGFLIWLVLSIIFGLVILIFGVTIYAFYTWLEMNIIEKTQTAYKFLKIYWDLFGILK